MELTEQETDVELDGMDVARCGKNLEQNEMVGE
jgi:hypothetical protein